jgi:peroxiredoxin
MIFSSLLVDPETFHSETGWEMKPHGACHGDRCLPLPRRDDGQVDVTEFASRLGMPIVHDAARGLFSLGPEDTGSKFLSGTEMPELTLPDLDGKMFDLASLRGMKVVLVAWAPWCGCGFDLPIWQQLREEWYPKGLEIVTVSLDSLGGEMARPLIEAANPTHPSLVDASHKVDQVFGIRNVPEGVWIDEEGRVVRPAEPAAPQEMQVMLHNIPMDENSPEHQKKMMDECWNIDVNAENYVTAIRDWVENGAASPFALSPEEVAERSRQRPPEVAVAAAEFTLGQHLHAAGDIAGAEQHFREAHALQPENWTYRRQAWHFADPTLNGPGEDWPYESDWLTETLKVGAENYYDVQTLDQMKSQRREA